MCGRYTLATPADELVEAFDVPPLAFDYVPRYNIAPSQLAPVVAADREGRRMGLLRWGFVPAGSERPSRSLINARAESVASRPAFREAFRRRRCLVPADGFYEWRKDEGRRQPFWIHPTRPGVLSFAGIWERWQGEGAEPLHTFAILTTDASDDVRELHDRMPAVIGEADRDRWLDPSAAEADLRALLRPAPAGSLAARAVSTRVNRAVDDDPGLLEPI